MDNLKYFLIPVGYISSVLLMEFFPNVLSVGLFLLVNLGSIIALVVLVFKSKQKSIQKLLILMLLSAVPIIDFSFGLSNILRDKLKGYIVFSAIDDSFATSKVLTIRQDGTALKAEFESSVAGFGETETAAVQINSDTITFTLDERQYSDVLVFDRNKNSMKGSKNSNYRILINKLMK